MNQKSLQIDEYAIAPYPALPSKEEKIDEKLIEDKTIEDLGATKAEEVT